jgi:hypothetical protein
MSDFRKCKPIGQFRIKDSGAVWDDDLKDDIGLLFEENDLGWVFDSHDCYYLTIEAMEAVVRWLKQLNGGR